MHKVAPGVLSSLLSIHLLLCESVTHFQDLNIRLGTMFNDPGSSLLTGIKEVSLRKCVELCSLKPKCNALEYQYLQKYCSLRTEVSPFTVTPGHLTVQGFNKTCESAICETSRTCQINSESCSVTECGYPDAYGDVTGNIFIVGSKLLHGTTTLVCGKDGTWRSIGQIPYSGLTCRDIKQSYNEATKGLYVNTLGITILCDFNTSGGNWLVFQNRFSGSVDFYRTWDEYKIGFGNLAGEFWLGLQNVYTILRNSSHEFELHISLEDWEGNEAFADYDFFDLDDESAGYRLHIGNYTGTAGDAMRRASNPHNGQLFTTKDRDNDNHGKNCAELYTGAWWYNRCHAANLNGVYHQGGNTTVYAENIIWEDWKGYYYSLKKTSMMIREKNPN